MAVASEGVETNGRKKINTNSQATALTPIKPSRVGCCVTYRLRAERSEGLKAKGNEMRIVVASLIVLAVLYFWDHNYDNGKLLDGLDSMRRSISHQVFN